MLIKLTYILILICLISCMSRKESIIASDGKRCVIYINDSNVKLPNKRKIKVKDESNVVCYDIRKQKDEIDKIYVISSDEKLFLLKGILYEYRPIEKKLDSLEFYYGENYNNYIVKPEIKKAITDYVKKREWNSSLTNIENFNNQIEENVFDNLYLKLKKKYIELVSLKVSEIGEGK